MADSQGVDAVVNRGKTWAEDEELAVIGVYFEDTIQRMVDGTSRNTAVYRRVSLKLAEMGIHRTSKECQTKLNNLKSWYKRQTDRVGKPGKSGAARQKRSKVFELLDLHLADRPATRPKVLFESNRIPSETDADEESVDQHDQDMLTGESDDGESDLEPAGDADVQPVGSAPLDVGDESQGEETQGADTGDETEEADTVATVSDAGENAAGSSTSNGKKRKTKQVSTRRKVPKYEKAMGSMRQNIEELQQETDKRFQEVLEESLRTQQKWEEEQREKDRQAYQKFQEDLLAAERSSMEQLGGILRSLFQPPQHLQPSPGPSAAFHQPQQYHIPSFGYHHSQPAMNHPTRTPQRSNSPFPRRLNVDGGGDATNLTELLAGASDVLNSS